MAVKAIQTEYNGYKFRSRLEAKWAVFFDSANITYRYEPEGYENEVGEERYLPDFYLPDFKAYAEVKGDEDQYRRSIARIKKNIEGDNVPIKRLIVLGNIPYKQEANGVFWYPVFYFHPLRMTVRREYKALICRDPIEKRVDFMLEWHTATSGVSAPKYEATDMWSGEEDNTGTICKEMLDPIPDDIINPYPLENDSEDMSYRKIFPSQFLVDAYKKARQARFEFGETPSAR